MLAFQDTIIKDLALHFVGNQFNEEPLILSKTKLAYKEVEPELLHYFFSSFNNNEYYHLHHDTDLVLNEVYSYVKSIFDNSDSLAIQSINLAKHLYANSTHPKIKGGEFYVVYFKNCLLEGEILDAVGIFKSENKDTFLKIKSSKSGFDIKSQEGINIDRLDKGCLVYNSDSEKGYVLSVLDNTNKGNDAKFWFDHFLNVKQREDAYYQTESAIAFTKSFITKELPQQFDANKADQADLLNKSAQYFKDQDEFDLSEFANVVIQQPEIIESFNDYKAAYQENKAIAFNENFNINEKAVKKKSQVFKSVIKLDKNFHIYVHGDRNKIEQGEDLDGRKYYTLYYDNET